MRTKIGAPGRGPRSTCVRSERPGIRADEGQRAILEVAAVGDHVLEAEIVANADREGVSACRKGHATSKHDSEVRGLDIGSTGGVVTGAALSAKRRGEVDGATRTNGDLRPGQHEWRGLPAHGQVVAEQQ